MAVYVDPADMPYRGMKMCHMIADTTGELLAMADAIGVDRRHIQYANAAREHFDICAAKRKMAVEKGAKEVTRRELGRLLVAKCETFIDAYLTEQEAAAAAAEAAA